MDDTQSRRLVWRHVTSIGTCMMATHDGDRVRARPMRGLARPEQNVVWFFSDRDTHKREEVDAAPDACITYADVKEQAYVSLSGKISIVQDKHLIEGLWNDGVDMYFPKGPDDPNLVLLRFEPEHGEFWDAPSSPLVMAIKFLQAKVTGERPELGTSGSVRLG